jgi:hypothetical protein
MLCCGRTLYANPTTGSAYFSTSSRLPSGTHPPPASGSLRRYQTSAAVSCSAHPPHASLPWLNGLCWDLGTVGRVDAVRAWLWSSDAIYILTATSGHAHSRGDRIAVVGANGCGKSSLLRLLAGSDQSDAGTMQLRKGLNVSYLAQDVDVEGDVTVLEMVLAADSGPAKAVREYEAAEASGDSDSLIDAMSR